MTVCVAAILLAAGKSRRMGSCKQLLPMGGNTVIARCLDALVGGGVSEVVLVTAEEGSGVVAAAQGYIVKMVVNPDHEGDMASSVRVGLDAITPVASGVIVALSDYPLVTAATIKNLIAAHAESPDSIIIPCYLERKGHPLLFPRSILAELTHDTILRHLVRRDPDRVRCLEVDDLGVLQDMDTPEDYRRLCDIINQSPSCQ